MSAIYDMAAELAETKEQLAAEREERREDHGEYVALEAVLEMQRSARLRADAGAALLRNEVNKWLQFYSDCAQLLDGWHNDGTAWSEWDESVRSKLTTLGTASQAALSTDTGKALAELVEEVRKEGCENVSWDKGGCKAIYPGGHRCKNCRLLDAAGINPKGERNESDHGKRRPSHTDTGEDGSNIS